MVGEAHSSTGKPVVFCLRPHKGLEIEDIKACFLFATKFLKNTDFGDKVYRDGHIHKGVILLRLEDERSLSKIRVISRLLKNYINRLPDSFVVVTEKQVRFARK
jgi:hypothetical protein